MISSTSGITIYDALIAEAERFGGSVIGFASDSLTHKLNNRRGWKWEKLRRNLFLSVI